MTENLIVEHVALLNGVYHLTLLSLVVDRECGDSLVHFGIEVGTDLRRYGLDSVLFKILDKLVIYQFDPLPDRRGVGIFIYSLKRTLKVVDYRQKTLQGIFSSVLNYFALFLDSTFTEIIEFGHQEQVFLLFLLQKGLCVVKLFPKFLRLVNSLLGHLFGRLGILLLQVNIVDIVYIDVVFTKFGICFCRIMFIMLFIHIS